MPEHVTLHDDLRALLERLGLELRAATPATARPGSTAKAAWHLEFADGRRLKGRVLPRAEDRDRYRAAAALSDGLAGFARVVAWHGLACLEEWIDGRPLESAERTPERRRELAHRAGVLLASLHAVQTPRPATDSELRQEQALLQQHVGALAERGALDGDAARRLLALAAPRAASIGLIHFDFCAENLVLTPAGEIVSVDNETLRAGPLELDVARSLARWPLTAGERVAFLAGLGPSGQLTVALPFWLARAACASAWFRTRDAMPDASQPLALARRLGAGAAGDGQASLEVLDVPPTSAPR